MKLKPVGNRLVLEPVSDKEQEKGGIVLPETVEKEKQEQAKVVALGSGKNIPEEIKVGDRVIFTKYGPNEVEIGEKKYLIADANDILAIIK